MQSHQHTILYFFAREHVNTMKQMFQYSYKANKPGLYGIKLLSYL